MKALDKLRSDGFWIMDYFRGGPVRRHYNDIREQFENYTSTKIVKKRQKNLENILQHATRTAPFYFQFKNFQSLLDFPVINKSTIMNNASLFFSNSFQKKELHKVSTSGSTGAPLTVWKDKEKRWRHQAENIYFNELAGSNLGSRIYYLKAWSELNKKSYLSNKINNVIMLNASDYLSDKNLEKLLNQLASDKLPKTLLAFSSSLDVLSRYVQYLKQDNIFNVTSIIPHGDAMPAGAIEILKIFFNCPVITRYTNLENGFLAQQCGDKSGEYHINTASFFVEVLDADKDEPAMNNEIGRIVVTDLFNFGMPLIRYDTGDMAIISDISACGRPGPVFKTVAGRKVDFVYDTKGNPISPYAITLMMWKYAGEIRQYQFVQNTIDGYLIELNPASGLFDREQELITDIKELVGNDANIQVNYVEEIPVLAIWEKKASRK